MMKKDFVKALLIQACILVFPVSSYAYIDVVTLIADSDQADFARSVLMEKLQPGEFRYSIVLDIDKGLSAQSFTIKTINSKIHVKGGDANGLMYGGLELAEMIGLNYDLSALSISKSPLHLNRGLKFNIPLDARCPSYDDTGDAAQKNIGNMWEFDFWKEFLDKMALYRYNVLSLWTPNPFQVMVKLPDYPDLALDDVCVTTSVPMGRVGEWSDAGGVNNVVLDNLEVVKKISIDNKIDHWQKVFSYAASRGIDIYLFTWNIYTNGTYGKYGLTDEIDNPATTAYYRQAINVFLQTYPQVKGIGITAGERMHVPRGRDVADAREEWLWNAYGMGILDYKEKNPEREVHFIHRIWYSDFDQIMKYWGEYPDPFDVGFKYIKARIYSSPEESPFIGSLKKSLKESNLRCWWNLRNDDIFVYRWGDPDYVRRFLSNLPGDVTAGYHMGADGYVFGRVFSDKENSINGSLELDKHWYKFMLWGRLGYDNHLPDKHIVQLLEERYDIPDAQLLFDSWQTASKIVPQVNRFIFHSGDRHWAPEMCSSRESFKFTPCFRIAGSMQSSNILNPIQYRSKLSNASLSTDDITPDRIIENLHSWADRVIENINGIPAGSAELKSIRADLEAFAWLGKYYAEKILAADQMEEIAYEGQTADAIEALNKTMQRATSCWEKYAKISDRFYNTQMYSRVNMMDWRAILKDVRYDQQIVAEAYTEKSLKSQLERQSEQLSVEFPYRVTKRVRVVTPEAGLAELALYDNRGELVNYYTHKCRAGTTSLMWEDMAWMPKGSYTMVFSINGRTAHCKFEY